MPYTLRLKQDIDFIYTDFCRQLSDVGESKAQSLEELIQQKEKIVAIEKEIEKLRSKIKNCKQFNVKVELNLKLQGKLRELSVFSFYK
jgi:rRNA maturation endonuclease Nob1